MSANLTNLNFEDESVKVIQWHGLFSILLIIFCSILGIISTSGKSMIIYYILYRAPRRPMNTMILFDQIGVLVTSLGMSVMTIGSLVMATPILEMFGSNACQVFYVTSVTHNVFMVINGWSMAVFRLICVRFQHYIRVSLEVLMTELMWVQFGCCFGHVFICWYAIHIYGSSSLFEFCNGYTTKVSKCKETADQ